MDDLGIDKFSFGFKMQVEGGERFILKDRVIFNEKGLCICLVSHCPNLVLKTGQKH